MFYEDLARGKKGEKYVCELMARRQHKVKDISEDTKAGFDFYIDEDKVELKTDYIINSSNNLFLEDYISYYKGGSAQGWFNTCKAKYLFYLDEHSLTLYIYLLDELRQYVNSNKSLLPYKSLDDGYKRVYGYCLNKDLVRRQVIEKDELLAG